MHPFPHILVLDSYISYFSNFYSFLIELIWLICVKLVAKRIPIFSLSYMEHVKVFNPFLLKKLNETVIWKESNLIPNVLWNTVSHPFLNVIIICVSCQEVARLIRVIVRSTPFQPFDVR